MTIRFLIKDCLCVFAKLCHLLRPEAMSEYMLQHNEEVLEGDVVGVQLSAELQAALNHLLHYQLADVDQVAPLDEDRVAL